MTDLSGEKFVSLHFLWIIFIMKVNECHLINHAGGNQHRRSKRKKNDVITLEDDDHSAAVSVNKQPAIRGNQHQRIPNSIRPKRKKNDVITLEDDDHPAAASANKQLAIRGNQHQRTPTPTAAASAHEHRAVLDCFPNVDPDWVRNMLATTRLVDLVRLMTDRDFPPKEIEKSRKKKRFADPFRSDRPLPSDEYFAEGI